MCFPTIEGEIDVEERRPRYQGEPRRKRLRIVSNKRFKNVEERALIRSFPRRLEREEAWDQEQVWQQGQQQQQRRRQQWQPHQQLELHHQNQQPLHEQPWQSLGFHPQPHVPPGFQHMQHPGMPGPAIGAVQQNPQQDFGNGIEEWGPGNQGNHLTHVQPRQEEWNPGNQGNHLTHMQPRHEEWNPGNQGNHGHPRLIESGPRARLPRHLRAHARRHKSQSPRRSRHDQRRDSSTDSSDSLDGSIRHGRHTRQSETRRFDPFDSFEDLRRSRQRSRSARRIHAIRR